MGEGSEDQALALAMEWLQEEQLPARWKDGTGGRTIEVHAWDVPMEVARPSGVPYLVLDAEIELDPALKERSQRADEDAAVELRQRLTAEVMRMGCTLGFEPHPNIGLVIYPEEGRAAFMQGLRRLHATTWLVGMPLRMLPDLDPLPQPPVVPGVEGAASPLRELLRATIEPGRKATVAEAEAAAQSLAALRNAEELALRVLDRLRAVGTDDPAVRAVGRGIGTAMANHLQAMHRLAEANLWVPFLCELRAYLESGVAAATFHHDPRRTFEEAERAAKVSVHSRMKWLGLKGVHDSIYGPLSNVAHNGYATTTCHQKSWEVPLSASSAERSKGHDVFPVVPVIVSPSGEEIPLPGAGIALVDGPIDNELARAMYLPMAATVAIDCALWVAKVTGVGRDARKPLFHWLESNGQLAFRTFPRAT